MKRFCLIIWSVMLLIMLAVPALAADVRLTATVSATTAQEGDEVVVTISSSGTTPFTSIGLFIEYDTSVFEFKSRSWGAAIADATTKSFDETSGKVTAVWDDPGAYSGEIIKITLTVKGSTPGNATVKFGELSCQNAGNSISIEGSSAQIALVCEHSYPTEWTNVDGKNHQKVCSKCNTAKVEPHTWDEGEPTSVPSCTEEGEEKYTCLDGCGATKTEKVKALGHQWDNNCDKTCNRKDCGYTREISHDYSTLWTTDASGHWHKCRSCGAKKDEAKHTPGPEATEEAAQICTVCKYEITPKVVHVHQFSEEWDSDSENHWHRCLTNEPLCIVKDSVASHDYDNACDIDCNTCGYVRVPPHNYSGEWQASVNGHWEVCTLCNARSEVWPHVPGPEATNETPQVCLECNFTIQIELNHVHDFGEKWYGDDTNHWQNCSDSRCLETASQEPHTWNGGEEMAVGGFRYTCTICGKQVILADPLPTEPDTTPSSGAPAKPGTPQNPAEQEAKDAIAWEWAGIAAIILLIIGVGLLVFEFIRSRKINTHGKFSK